MRRLEPLSAASPWFHRRRFGDEVTQLWEPHVDPLLRCNVWHVRGCDADLLVDTGLGLTSLRAAAADLLDRSVIAFATHTHFDHTGGMHEFSTRLVHRAEAASLAEAADAMMLTLDAFDPELVTSLRAAGYSLANECLLTAAPYAGFEPQAHRLLAAPATRIVDEGDVVNLGNRQFEVLHLPGHSPGSAGLWEARTRTLFAGDALYNGPLLANLPGSDLKAYVRTLQRLRDLPVDIVHAGHEASFGRERLHELIDHYLVLWCARS